MKKNIYDVCIVGGLGHVGLPLGISLAQSGRKVVLYDINKEVMDTFTQGEMPFMEKGAEEKWPWRRESVIGARGDRMLEPPKPPGRLARATNQILWILVQPLVWWIRWRGRYDA